MVARRLICTGERTRMQCPRPIEEPWYATQTYTRMLQDQVNRALMNFKIEEAISTFPGHDSPNGGRTPELGVDRLGGTERALSPDIVPSSTSNCSAMLGSGSDMRAW